MITKEEFIKRFKQDMVDAGVSDEMMVNYVPFAAMEDWEKFNDPRMGYQGYTPEEMAEENRECWD